MPRPIRVAAPRRARIVAAFGALVLGLLGALVPAVSASAAGIASGRVLDQAGQPVVGVEVQIIGGGVTRYVDTDATGTYTSPSLASGNYQAYLYEGEADVDGQYVSTALEFFSIADADVTLPDLEVQRYVNISGEIDNWTPDMGDVRVSLWYEIVPGTWQMVNNTPRPNYFYSDDEEFTVNAPLEAREYTLYFQFDDYVPYLDAFYGGELDDAADAVRFTGVPNVGVTGLTQTMPAAAVISGRVTSQGQPLEGVEVDAENLIDDDRAYGFAETDADGTYELYVRPGDPYVVYAYGDIDHPGAYYYTGSDPCGCVFDPVTATLADPAEDIDIDLIFEQGVIDIEGAVGTASFQPLDGVEVRLYAPSGDGWVVRDSRTSGTQGDFFFDDQSQGRYRIQFVSPSGVLQIVSGITQPDGANAPSPLDPVPACWVDLGSLASDVYVIALVDSPTPAGTCANLPAPTTPPTGGGSTQPAPSAGGTRPPARPSSGAVPATAPTATPTPTPSATPSATPRPSTAPETDEPSTEPTSTPEQQATSPDLSWVLWTGVALLVILVVGGVILILRRRP